MCSQLVLIKTETHKKTLRSHSSSEVSETSLELPELDSLGEATGYSDEKDESKPALPSRMPRLGQSSLIQTAVLPVMTTVQDGQVKPISFDFGCFFLS